MKKLKQTLKNKEVIQEVFKDNAYNISLVPFDDWIVYQMEEVA